MRNFGFTVKKVACELDLTYFKFKQMARAGAFDFVKIERGKAGRDTYHFDPVRTTEYINEYKENRRKSTWQQ